MTHQCHSHIAFCYKRLMLCKYIKSRPFKRDLLLTQEQLKAALYLASRPFRKRDDVRHRVPLRHTITPTDSSTFLRVSLSPFRYLPCRNESRNEFTNGPFEDRPTTRLGLLAFNHDPTRAEQLWAFEKLTGIEIYTYYQFPYAPCRVLVLREATTSRR